MKESLNGNFWQRFYLPRQMFLKRNYKWWQNSLFILFFAAICTLGAFLYLSRPSFYKPALRSSLAPITKEANNTEFRSYLTKGKIVDSKFIYQGSKKVIPKKKFVLGIDLSSKEVKKTKPQNALVFNKNEIIIYLNKDGSKSYQLDEIKIPYSKNFDLKTANISTEIEDSWISAYSALYIQSIPFKWFFSFLYLILIIMMVVGLIVRMMIRKVKNSDDKMAGVFGFLINASLIPIVLVSILGAIYFYPFLMAIIYLILLIINVIISWQQTKFLDNGVVNET